jgi:hypothetical protein
MNKEAIIKTATTTWSDEDECFVTESPLADTISGAGDTTQESYQAFLEMVEANWEAYKKGKHALYPKPSRLKKGKVRITAEIDPEFKKALAIMAKDLGISQGEALEYLYSFYRASAHTMVPEPRRGERRAK